MKNNNLIYLLFILISCNTTNRKSTESKEYKELATVYRVEHLDHFPKSRPIGFNLIGHGAMYIGAYDFARGFILYQAPKKNCRPLSIQ